MNDPGDPARRASHASIRHAERLLTIAEAELARGDGPVSLATACTAVLGLGWALVAVADHSADHSKEVGALTDALRSVNGALYTASARAYR